MKVLKFFVEEILPAYIFAWVLLAVIAVVGFLGGLIGSLIFALEHGKMLMGAGVLLGGFVIGAIAAALLTHLTDR